AAGSGEHRRLRDELQDNVHLARAQRTAQTNLPRALRNAGQHDVHDHDSANYQKNRSEPHGHGENISGQGLPEAHDRIRADDAEIVRAVPGNMPPGAQQHTRLIFGSWHQLRALRLDKQHQRVALRTPFLAESLQGNENEIILRLPEGTADDRRYADDFIAVRSGTNGLADGIYVGG